MDGSKHDPSPQAWTRMIGNPWVVHATDYQWQCDYCESNDVKMNEGARWTNGTFYHKIGLPRTTSDQNKLEWDNHLCQCNRLGQNTQFLVRRSIIPKWPSWTLKSFTSVSVKRFRHSNGIEASQTTSYSLHTNGQVKRLNGILWEPTFLRRKSQNMSLSYQEEVLRGNLYSVRFSLCTATKATPQEPVLRNNRVG